VLFYRELGKLLAAETNLIVITGGLAGRIDSPGKMLSALGSLQVADACEETIPVGGPDGKPFYMAGPDDDVEHIMNTLTRKCGHGNFEFVAPFGSVPGSFFD